MTTEVVTAEPAGEDEQRWWKLLRRVFEIPDIVSARHAEEAIMFALLKREPPNRNETAFRGDQERIDDCRTVVETIVEMGGKGELDELFVAVVGLIRTDPGTIRNRIFGSTGLHLVGPLIDEALTAITDYVKAHPFDTSNIGPPTAVSRA
jgi:hypothetical protein